MIKTSTLENGLRVVTDSAPSMHSVALGVWVGAGTRDENMAHNGAAHMVEHMLFKGTPSRNARDIAEAIENVGGHMNAYTSREITSYHAHVLKDDAPLALDIIGDMVQHAALPDDEIERERQVILQEIGMCHDSPDDLVFDHYYETAWPGQTLGAPILGTPDIIGSMTKDTLRTYIKTQYSADRIVVSAAGYIDHDAFVSRVQDVFTDVPDQGTNHREDARYTGGENRTDKDLEQSHIVMGFQAFNRLDDQYHAGRVLATVLGGGMSSRLFQEIREKRGLVYAGYSFYAAYMDDGVFGIYAGTGPDKLPELMPVLCDEIRKLADTITPEELHRAKTQLKAGLLMGRESMMTRADQNAKHVLYRNEILNIEEVIKSVDVVDSAALKRAATDIFSSPHTMSALGPLKPLEPYNETAERLAA